MLFGTIENNIIFSRPSHFNIPEPFFSPVADVIKTSGQMQGHGIYILSLKCQVNAKLKNDPRKIFVAAALNILHFYQPYFPGVVANYPRTAPWRSMRIVNHDQKPFDLSRVRDETILLKVVSSNDASIASCAVISLKQDAVRLEEATITRKDSAVVAEITHGSGCFHILLG